MVKVGLVNQTGATQYDKGRKKKSIDGNITLNTNTLKKKKGGNITKRIRNRKKHTEKQTEKK